MHEVEIKIFYHMNNLSTRPDTTECPPISIPIMKDVMNDDLITRLSQYVFAISTGMFPLSLAPGIRTS